ALDSVGNQPEVSIARDQFRPGVANSDHRPAIEQVGGKALVLHPRTMNESIFILEAKPVSGTERSLFAVVHSFEISKSTCHPELRAQPRLRGEAKSEGPCGLRSGEPTHRRRCRTK